MADFTYLPYLLGHKLLPTSTSSGGQNGTGDENQRPIPCVFSPPGHLDASKNSGKFKAVVSDPFASREKDFESGHCSMGHGRSKLGEPSEATQSTGNMSSDGRLDLERFAGSLTANEGTESLAYQKSSAISEPEAFMTAERVMGGDGQPDSWMFTCQWPLREKEKCLTVFDSLLGFKAHVHGSHRTVSPSCAVCTEEVEENSGSTTSTGMLQASSIDHSEMDYPTPPRSSLTSDGYLQDLIDSTLTPLAICSPSKNNDRMHFSDLQRNGTGSQCGSSSSAHDFRHTATSSMVRLSDRYVLASTTLNIGYQSFTC